MNPIAKIMSKASAVIVSAVMFLMSVAPVGAYTTTRVISPTVSTPNFETIPVSSLPTNVPVVTKATTAPIVSSVSVSPSTFNPQNGEMQAIRFTVDKAASIDIDVLSIRGVIVKTITADSNVAAATHTYYWSGKDNSGANVAAGTYNIRVTATNTYGADFETVVSTVAYAAVETAPQVLRVFATPSTINPQNNEIAKISFYLDKKATTDLIVYNRGGTAVNTIFAGATLGAGTYTYYWGGKDSSGKNVAAGTYDAKVTATNTAGTGTNSTPITVAYPTTGALSFTNHYASPASFDPQAGQTTTIYYSLSQSAYVSVSIMQGTNLVKRLTTSVYGQSGSATWNGKYSSGAVAAEGTYTYQVYASVSGQEATAAGNMVVAYGVTPPPTTNLRVLSHNAYPSTFNPRTQSTTISYTLNKPASVNVRIRNYNSDLVKTMTAGENATSGAVTWDGRDQWGSVVSNGSYKYEIYAFVGSENTTAYGYVYINSDGNGNGGYNENAPYITNATVSPNPFNPYVQSTQLTYSINTSANITIQVLDKYKTNQYKKTIADTVYRNAGTYYVSWDGRDYAGQIVPEGTYSIQLTAANSAGNDMRNIDVSVNYNYYGGNTCTDPYYCPSYNTRPYIFSDYVSPNPFRVGYNEPAINFMLNTGARVTVTITKDGSTIRTITSNEFKNAGANYVTWNGRDYSGNYVSVGTYMYRISAENGYGSDTKTDYIYATSKVGEVVPCGGFNDVSVSSPYCRAILQMVKLGIFEGYGNGTFGANTPITRAETVKVILKALNKPIQVANSYSTPFWDVVVSQWYANFVYTAKLMGIVNGYPDGSFKPADTVNRVELLKIFLRTAGTNLPVCNYAPYEDTPVTYETKWYLPYVCYSRKYTLVDGVGSFFQPDRPMKRGDVATLFYRYQVQNLFNTVTNPTYSPDNQYIMPDYNTPAY